MDANVATTPAPAGQGQTANGNENQRVPFFQKIISIIVQMLIMHTIMNFISGGKNKIDPKNESTNINNLILRNSFENDDIFDIYVFLSNNHSLDFEYIQKNSKLIQIREKELYTYKQFSNYENMKYSFYLDDTWKGEKYLSVVAIPLHCYDKRNESSLLKSTIKKSFKHNVLVDNIPLTVKKEPFEAEKNEKYNLMKEDYKVKIKKKKRRILSYKKKNRYKYYTRFIKT